MKLAVPAEKINVGRVLKHTEKHIPLVQCFNAAQNACVLSPACRLKTVLGEAERTFYDVLSAYTLADLARPAASRRIIEKVRALAK